MQGVIQRRIRHRMNTLGAAVSPELAGLGLDDSGSKQAPSIVLPHQDGTVDGIALDIGGSLVKLAYFTRSPDGGGKLRFEKFETSRIEECLEFIELKRLHRASVKATGGGAYKYAQLFKERLGIDLEREDEMSCMVAGCNFLLKAVSREAFEYSEHGELTFKDIEPSSMYPYLLVNIGSGVRFELTTVSPPLPLSYSPTRYRLLLARYFCSMVRVDNETSFSRVSGTNIGGGTFWGLARLLTGCSSFDEILQLSSHGDNSKVDMLVGDIYGGRDYTSIGLSADTIASSFGKVLHEDKSLEDYSKADIAMSLCRMISYNIGQLAYLNAKRYGLRRIFFGGFFIRGHAYTMEIISYAIKFWSQGEMSALFLRHEGFLGAMGAFMQVKSVLQSAVSPAPDVRAAKAAASKVRARFVEKFDDTIQLPDVAQREDDAADDRQNQPAWIDKLQSATAAAKSEHDLALARKKSAIDLQVGVLHFSPTSEPFPLLSQQSGYRYVANTIDINADAAEMAYWVGILQDQLPTVMEKAASSQGNTKEAMERAGVFGQSLDACLSRYRCHQSSAVDRVELSNLFEVREELLREAGFEDVYRLDKQRENAAALEALEDLLADLDRLDPPARLLSLIQGALAANIFDWGAKACVDLYHTATILDMYRDARARLSTRPWRVDDFDEFRDIWLSKWTEGEDWVAPYRRAMIFVDNAGADVVLGVIPLARELLRGGAEVILAANSRPAINDITCEELMDVINAAAKVCPIIKAAWDRGLLSRAASVHSRVPPPRGLMERVTSVGNLSSLGHAANFIWPTDEAGRDEDCLREPEQSCAKLYVVENGQGSPCLDLNRVSKEVGDATVGTDLVVFIGMGACIDVLVLLVLLVLRGPPGYSYTCWQCR